MRALLIEVDFRTGVRAGGINPKDKGLQCYGWQDLDKGIELRIVTNDKRDISMYKNQRGITILEGEDEINQAITETFGEERNDYKIESELLLIEAIKEKGKLSDLVGMNRNEIAQYAIEHNLAGVSNRKTKIPKIKGGKIV